MVDFYLVLRVYIVEWSFSVRLFKHQWALHAHGKSCLKFGGWFFTLATLPKVRCGLVYAFSTYAVEVSEDRQAQNIKCHDFRGFLTKASTLQNCLFIGVGAGPAGPVLVGPLFRQFTSLWYLRARTVTDGVPYACANYSRTTLKVLPTPLLFSVSNQTLFYHPVSISGFQWQTFECDTLSLYHPLSYILQNDHKCRFQQFQGPLIVWLKKFQNTISSITPLTIPSSFKELA